MITVTMTEADHQLLLECLAVAREAVIRQVFLGSLSEAQQTEVKQHCVSSVARIDQLRTVVGRAVVDRL